MTQAQSEGVSDYRGRRRGWAKVPDSFDVNVLAHLHSPSVFAAPLGQTRL